MRCEVGSRRAAPGSNDGVAARLVGDGPGLSTGNAHPAADLDTFARSVLGMDSHHRVELDRLPAPPPHGLGVFGEDLAAAHLRDADDLQVLARNWRLRAGELRGELDLVALDETAGQLVVVEVKTRRDAERFGGALHAVSHRKAAKVRTLTAAFLRQAGIAVGQVRLDVVAIDLGRRPVLNHLLGVL
jgi:putative endonuclease